MTNSLRDLLPRDKHDIAHVDDLEALGYPAVEPLLPELIAWMRDANWPIAARLGPFLASIGAPLAPHVRRVFATDDDVWKLWLLTYVVGPSDELSQFLAADVERIANDPTEGERLEEVHIAAHEIRSRTLGR